MPAPIFEQLWAMPDHETASIWSESSVVYEEAIPDVEVRLLPDVRHHVALGNHAEAVFEIITCDGQRQWTVQRDYNEFVQLHCSLETTLGCKLPLPKIPKLLVLVSERRRHERYEALQTLLREAVRMDPALRLPELHRFLCDLQELPGTLSASKIRFGPCLRRPNHQACSAPQSQLGSARAFKCFNRCNSSISTTASLSAFGSSLDVSEAAADAGCLDQPKPVAASSDVALLAAAASAEDGDNDGGDWEGEHLTSPQILSSAQAAQQPLTG